MRIWNITTRSNSIYRVTEENGVWKFGAVDIPSNGFGTLFLGANHEIMEPIEWPPKLGESMVVYAADKFPDGYDFVHTSPVESVTEVTNNE